MQIILAKQSLIYILKVLCWRTLSLPYFPAVFCFCVFVCTLSKGQCHEIFDLYFFLFEPIWVSNKQAKMVFLKSSFSRRYSNLKFEKFDSAQANTAGSRFFKKLAL